MAEQHIDEFLGANFNANNYSAVRAARSGVAYQELGALPGETELIRMEHSLERAVDAVGGGRIYHDSSDDPNEFSVTDLLCIYRGSVVTIAGGINKAMTGGNVAHYVYADPATATFVINTTGWPTTPHVRIAVITLVAGAWSWANVVEHRHSQALRIVAEPLSAKFDQEDFTGNDVLTAAECGKMCTNIGAGGEAILTLPTPSKGLWFQALVMAAQYLRLKADTGHTIRRMANVSASGGYIRSNVVGSYVLVAAVSTTQWVILPPDDSNWTIDA